MVKTSRIIKDQLESLKVDMEREFPNHEFKINTGGAGRVNSSVEGHEHYKHIWLYDEYLSTDIETADGKSDMVRFIILGMGEEDGMIGYTVQRKVRNGPAGVNKFYKYNLTLTDALASYRALLSV